MPKSVNPGNPPCILVTGATGYIGGRLVPQLLERGYRVHCVSRDADKLRARPWGSNPHVEVVECDAADEQAMQQAMVGVEAAYYLIHSMMAAGSDYAERDRTLARAFARGARNADVKRIVYLGGLGETGEDLSEHLSSRRDVEEDLASTGVPVTVLRAAMIIGSGSASFEILRYLVERLPVMVTPRWVSTECQPIAVSDVLHYLVATIETPETAGRAIDIGGPDVLTYRDLMREMARARHLPSRIIIPVPVLTPRLSSLWIHLVTPLSHRIARPLAEGLRNRVVCRNDDAHQLMPHTCLTVREAIEASLEHLRKETIETAWSDAGVIPGDPDWSGGTVFVDCRSLEVRATPQDVHRAVCRIGGANGYHTADWLWWLRGLFDRLVGGPGLRRGRRDRQILRAGDALDFWRVTRVDAPRSVKLRAEMKLPGIATLEFEVQPIDGDSRRCTLVQTARFMPRGLFGMLYWYSVYLFHGLVFKGMLKGVARDAEAFARIEASDEWREAAPVNGAEQT